MKICTECREPAENNWACPRCHHQPATHLGFPQFAPALNKSEHGYDPDLFAVLASLEHGNYWFESRNDLIVQVIRKLVGRPTKILEIGCGSGFVLSRLESEFPDAAIVGSEALCEGLDVVVNRTRDVELLQMDARDIPYKSEFDLIGAFDVIEHIDEDKRVLEQIFQSLTDQGTLLLTVPQHPFLWSKADAYARHVRRYTRSELDSKLAESGFKVRYQTSFVSLLLPLMCASRLYERLRPTEYDPRRELDISPAINKFLRYVMRVELALINKGLTLPIGGSLLVVATKSPG